MLRKRVEDMRWYRNKRVDDGISRHPTNSENWKEFDLQHPEFALEPRNVRLRLATDGFNLFGNMNNSYSMWPVALIPYNLLPWLQVLPIGMRGFVDKDISTILFELGSLFQDLCFRSLRRNDLENLEDRIVLILCKFEMFFPPAFFDVMVHIAVHLPREAILGGPVQYRWMYPIERFLRTLKGYVSNRARPEGSIAKTYILKESQPTGLITKNGKLSSEFCDIAHWYLLYNSPELQSYLEYVKQDFYLPDSKSGESWQVVQCVQYRRVFDVPDDVEPEVIREDEIMAEHRDDDENEEHDIADDDVDPDLDYEYLRKMSNIAKDTHKITNYEYVRLARIIKDNQEKMNALGLKQLTSVIRKSSLLKYANAKRKRIIVEVDDDDYVPSIGGDDNDDESSSSSMHEVIEMLDSEGDSPAPHIFEGDLPVPYILEEDSLVPQIHGAVVLSTDTPSSSVVTSTSKRTRGLTRSIEDQFDLQGEPGKINKSLNTSARRKLGDFKTKLYIKYKTIVKEKGKDYARSHPPSNCTLEQ
uniref:DUF4218 domain-containing protein n=1 Tax=Fagus sylvatica TaxID=28930 RepID=A0A2N9IMH0_FAGSY